jgi:hypothetical protein
MTNKLLFLVALIPLLIAPSQVFAISSNQTGSNEATNNLLKQLIKIENTTQVLQQDNANVLVTKLDIIKVELERILVQLQAPPTLPPPPTSFPVPLPPGAVPCGSSPCMPFGCGLGTDNSLCNLPLPVPSPQQQQQQQDQQFNATTSMCKPQNDNGVLIYPCPLSTFPSGLLPPLPIPTPPTFPIPPFTADCINTIYGVFCPRN